MIEVTGAMPDILDSRIRRSIKSAESPDGEAFAQACARRVEKGDTGAYFAPAVRLVVDATLGVANHRYFSPMLKSEMTARQLGISAASREITRFCIDQGVFASLYRNQALDGAQVSENDRAHLHHQPYMERLTSGPFNDIRWVAGGGLQLLRDAGVEDPREVIQRSTSLAAISSVSPPENFNNAIDYFGSEYVNKECLELHEGPPPKVTFTPEARQRIAGWSEKGRGCPASRIGDPEHGTTLLAYWPQVVETLMPEGVTVNGT